MKTSKSIFVLISVALISLILFSGCNGTNKTTETTTTLLTETTIVTTQPQTHNIEITNFAFSPFEISIKKGDTVIWTNGDSIQHSITSDSGNELNSDLLSNGGSYSHTFNVAGIFEYHCKIHSSMKGKIIVE